MADKDERSQQLDEAFKHLAADEMQALTDDQLSARLEGAVIYLQAVMGEVERRSAVQAGEPDTPIKPIGRA